MLIRAVLRGAGLFVRVQLGQNYERRLCSGVPNDAECLILTHIRGVFPMLKSQKLRVPSDDKQQKSRRRRSPAAMYADTQLRG